MNKLKLEKEEGLGFYKGLNERIEKYFSDKGIRVFLKMKQTLKSRE